MSTQDDCTRNVSKGMISLMKLLDSYDNCIDVSDHEIPENLTLSLNADVKHSRRYIWDEECHQEDAPKIGVAGVKEKMKVLQDEIKKKTVQVTELKTVMARKRLAKERNVKKLREDGEKRMEFLKQEYDKKRQTFQRNTKQNHESLEDMRRKMDDLEKQINNINQGIPTLCRQLEREGTEELLVERQRWKSEEKTKLVKLAKVKSAEMKAEAAKTIEPELRKLVEEHNEKKMRLMNEIESKLQGHRNALEEDLGTKIEREKRSVDNEVEMDLRRVDEYFKKKMNELHSQLKRKLEMVEIKSNGEKDSFMSSYRIKLEDLKIECRRQEKIRNEECEKDIYSVQEETHKKILQKRKEIATRIQEDSCRMDASRVEWKHCETLQQSEDFRVLLETEDGVLRAKAASDLNKIKEKLCEKFEGKKYDMVSKHEGNMKGERERLELELKDLIQRCKFTQSECEELKFEESNLRNELKETRARMANALQTLHKTESTLEVQSNLDVEREQERKVRREGTEKELRRIKLALQLTEEEIRLSTCKLSEQEESLDIEIQAVHQESEEEVENVQNKIDMILEKKRQRLKERETELSSFKQKAAEMQDKLSHMRQADLLK